MVMFRSAVADWNVVSTGAMQPTIEVGDRNLVDRMTHDRRLPLTHFSLLHLADPRRGDIVLLSPDPAHHYLPREERFGAPLD